jgi:Uma2 family endonuclease
MVVQVTRRLFSVTEYEHMAATGVLNEDDHVELIEGEVLTMSPLGPRHAAVTSRLNRLFHHLLGDSALIRVQDPIRLNDFSEPEPDLALVHPRTDFYADGHPEPEDVILLVEVADSSLVYDREVKIPLYARAGIPEVLLIAPVHQLVEVYQRPSLGEYQHITQKRRGDTVQLESFPEITISVDSVLGSP